MHRVVVAMPDVLMERHHRDFILVLDIWRRRTRWHIARNISDNEKTNPHIKDKRQHKTRSYGYSIPHAYPNYFSNPTPSG